MQSIHFAFWKAYYLLVKKCTFLLERKLNVLRSAIGHARLATKLFEVIVKSCIQGERTIANK